MPRRSAPRPSRPGRSRAAGPRRAPKAERWLNLIAFLLDHHFPVPREAIFRGVADYRRDWVGGDSTARESVRRKFERDKKELKALGIIIKPDNRRRYADHAGQEVDAYALKAGDIYLPYLEVGGRPASRRKPYLLPTLTLRPDDLALLRRAAERVQALEGSPLAASAASAVRKLCFDLPEMDPGTGEVVLPAPVAPGLVDHFTVLRAAVEGRRPISCRYYGIGRDAVEERTIEPYGLMLSWGLWYCIGRAPERDALRVFRLSRMQDVQLDERAPPFTVPADFSVRDYLNRSPWELSDAPAVPVTVRIAFPQSRWALAEGLGEPLEPASASGDVLLRFQVRAVDAFIRWLLPLGNQAVVIEPAGVRDRLAAERERLRALYR